MKNHFQILSCLAVGGSIPARKVLASRKQLPVSERIQIIEDLWDSIADDPSAIGLTPAGPIHRSTQLIYLMYVRCYI